jgi:hypothetical protein
MAMPDMRPAGDLQAALSVFLRAYLARPDLVARQRGWSPLIALRATDTGAGVAVQFQDGRPVPGASSGAPTLIVSSDERTLCEVLALALSPNEPYLFGELTVQGPEADFFRLDYVATELCPR